MARTAYIWLVLQASVVFISAVFAYGLTALFPAVCGANQYLPISATFLGACTGGYIVAGGITFLVWNTSLILAARRLNLKH